MFKKSNFLMYLFLFLTLIILLTPIHGQRKTVIKYWLWLDDPTDPMFPDLVKQFNSLNPDIQVEYELIPLSQYYDKLVTAIGAGTAPDAARFKDWWIGAFVDAGALEPLDNYLKNWRGYSDVISNLWNTGKISAKSPIYMMPHQFITFYLYYRKDWFKEKNLPPPTDLNKFLDAAKKLTDPTKNRYGF
jgi:multiple sugar transport system substrate-binding protein